MTADLNVSADTSLVGSKRAHLASGEVLPLAYGARRQLIYTALAVSDQEEVRRRTRPSHAMAGQHLASDASSGRALSASHTVCCALHVASRMSHGQVQQATRAMTCEGHGWQLAFGIIHG